MEEIKNALTQAGSYVQQAAHTVVEAIRGGEHEETTKNDDEKSKEKANDSDKKPKGKGNDSDDDEKKTEENIDSRQKKFDKEQDATIQHSEITAPPGGYHDPGQKSNAKVLATSWPNLKGKSRHDAEEAIKAKGYSNIKVMKKGTSSTTEHDESRVILYVDDNDIVVEEPKVG